MLFPNSFRHYATVSNTEWNLSLDQEPADIQPTPGLLNRLTSKAVAVVGHNGCKVLAGLTAATGMISIVYGGPPAMPFWIAAGALWGASTTVSVATRKPDQHAMETVMDAYLLFATPFLPLSLITFLPDRG